MSYTDIIFKDTLEEILEEDWEVDNRATWSDGTPVATKRIFGVVNTYDLSKEFPALTLKPTFLKGVFREDDWIYRQRSNNVNDLKTRIWDAWADDQGSIGKAYGFQIAKPIGGYDNQMDYILGEIKKNPTSRRLVMEMWSVEDLPEMNLPPCCHHIQFVVKDNKLNVIVKQRSQDYMVANNWNVVQYALLTHMVARHCGLQVGILKHVIGDCHIYNKHQEQAEELMKREPLPAPTLWINPDVTDFYEFTEDDFKLVNYETHPQMKLEVAI